MGFPLEGRARLDYAPAVNGNVEWLRTIWCYITRPPQYLVDADREHVEVGALGNDRGGPAVPFVA